MVVRMRSTRAHTANRRAHHKLKTRDFVKCADCGSLKNNHQVCQICGKYKGRDVLGILSKVEKKEKKRLKQEKENSATK
ncbi:MAG: 50S ribosomal protein L32 [Patescibacteria group bacterium]